MQIRGKNWGLLSAWCVVCPLFIQGVSAQESSESAAATGPLGFEYDFSVRYRYEGVSQDNPLEDAGASTARSRLTLQARPLEKLRVLLEVDNVSTIGPDEYDSFINDEYRGTYSVVADPVGTDLNQLLLGYEIAEGHDVIAGRQRINHVNQRFVGGVGWRQNEQTYDAATYQYKKGDFALDYSYLWEVERIFSGKYDSVQIEEFDSESHIMLGTYQQDWGVLQGFVYALDFSNAEALSSMTYGIAYAGRLGPVNINASIAEQRDYGDNPVSYDAGYLSLDGSLDVGPLNLLLGYEVLGSDDGRMGFSTPLATLHAFQGWADMFLSTPANGLEDVYATVSGKAGPVNLALTYHDFSADEGGRRYGTEWDMVATWPINEIFNAQLKYADYQSDNYAVDTEKFWVTINFTF